MLAGDKEVNWMSLDEAQAAQKKNPKKIFVDVYTPWCGPCKIMANTTLKDSRIVEYLNTHYYSVKFNGEGPDPVTFKGETFTNPNYQEGKAGRNSVHQLTPKIAATQRGLLYPTTVYFGEDLEILTAVPGMRDVQSLHEILSWFATDAHLQVSWEVWQQQEYPKRFNTGQ